MGTDGSDPVGERCAFRFGFRSEDGRGLARDVHARLTAEFREHEGADSARRTHSGGQHGCCRDAFRTHGLTPPFYRCFYRADFAALSACCFTRSWIAPQPVLTPLRWSSMISPSAVWSNWISVPPFS